MGGTPRGLDEVLTIVRSTANAHLPRRGFHACAECRVTSDGPVTPRRHYQALNLGGVSWLDVAWILVGTVVMAAAAGTIFVLGAYVFGLL